MKINEFFCTILHHKKKKYLHQTCQLPPSFDKTSTVTSLPGKQLTRIKKITNAWSELRAHFPASSWIRSSSPQAPPSAPQRSSHTGSRRTLWRSWRRRNNQCAILNRSKKPLLLFLCLCAVIKIVGKFSYLATGCTVETSRLTKLCLAQMRKHKRVADSPRCGKWLKTVARAIERNQQCDIRKNHAISEKTNKSGLATSLWVSVWVGAKPSKSKNQNSENKNQEMWASNYSIHVN